MKDGDVVLYGPDGEPLFRFHAFKPYRRSGQVGFRPPLVRESLHERCRGVRVVGPSYESGRVDGETEVSEDS